MYELTITLADRFRTTPFEFFRQECDEVLSLINHFLEKEAGKIKAEQKKASDEFWNF